ncbi:restriction endonuclease subunit S [Mycoplasmopsis cynos]|uniref:restriction endonuclease subunit S n=1 Tax=Mycoplasmopsis cynos TaxID=171284 RepID=UPI002B000149|nr:restriction endonuclease subunit S [Mycoplasmopsis cynos]WQQ17440.1 restriction endonuclease subunit S [Mycoplasmopsis cynos]
MSKNNMVPSIRFKEFTNAWEQERLGKISNFSTGKGITISQSLSKGFPIVSGGIDVMGYYSKYNRMENTITIARAGKCGYVSFISEKFYLNDKCFSLDLKENINSYFLFNLLKKNEKRIMELGSNSSIPTITSTSLKAVDIFRTSYDEQKAIAILFVSINSLIALHQRKLNALENLKKTLLEKMFPSENSVFPSIRFKEFTNAWEQERFNLLFRFVCKKGFKNLPILAATKENGMQKRQDINFNVQFNLDNIIKYKLVEPGQFVIHLSSYDSGLAHSTILGVTSPAYSVVDFINKENNDDKFWTFILKSKSFIDKLSSISYGLRVGKSINLNELNNIHLKSTNLIEQNKISKLFSLLNSLITLHQRKLNALENLKKTLLEKMFV